MIKRRANFFSWFLDLHLYSGAISAVALSHQGGTYEVTCGVRRRSPNATAVLGVRAGCILRRTEARSPQSRRGTRGKYGSLEYNGVSRHQ